MIRAAACPVRASLRPRIGARRRVDRLPAPEPQGADPGRGNSPGPSLGCWPCGGTGTSWARVLTTLRTSAGPLRERLALAGMTGLVLCLVVLIQLIVF